MSDATPLFLTPQYNQLLEVIKQLSMFEKQQLLTFLFHQVSEQKPVLTHFASEQVLAKDWLSPEEDEAWKDL